MSQGGVQNGSTEIQGAPVALPSISLPKGGGAIRGTDEKFSTNAATGAANFTVPFKVSPARAGFQPDVSLSYDSSAGNGPFGLGWTLSFPSITRKTSKGLPRYDEANEAEVFILSGSEDLVPLYQLDAKGAILLDSSGNPVRQQTTRNGFIVQRYGPRVESAFTRIERWVNVVDSSIHWRTITGKNVTSIYGLDDNSRIKDPVNGRVFSWLASQSYDDKGNAIVYEYKPEDSQSVVLPKANEFNRTDTNRSANRYLKSIKYGNQTPNRDSKWTATNPSLVPSSTWMFEVVFDYGEHDASTPTTAEPQLWSARLDPFSTYRSGFEIRCYRLCRRILMFHHFQAELKVQDYLVRSLDIGYLENAVASMATSFTYCGYVRQAGKSGSASYLKKILPPLELEYSRAPTASETAALSLQDFDANSLENVPAGIGKMYAWVDLDGEGLPGILVKENLNWYYKRNSSANNFRDASNTGVVKARLNDLLELQTFPDTNVDALNLEDLAATGLLDAVSMSHRPNGYWKRTTDGGWEAFKYFDSLPSIATLQTNQSFRFIDLTGDGLADILMTDSDAFTWYIGMGEAGWGTPEWLSQSINEEMGPRIVFSNPDESIYLADMSGDGLTDLVRIRNKDVCYWPNTGYGTFGPKVTLDSITAFDTDQQFHPEKITLADINGSGTNDVIYFGDNGIDIYYNQSGNSLSERVRIDAGAGIDFSTRVPYVADVLGNGTACILISSSLPGESRQSLRYIDLMIGQKPYLLTKAVNNLGAETRIRYAPSTQFYLEDIQSGRTPASRLAFPVQCVARVETYDAICQNRFVTRYAYHDGYYDGVEREFHGFGMVEQWDTEELDVLQATADAETAEPAANLNAASYIPPVYTKTWYHTGAWALDGSITKRQANEYYQLPAQVSLDDSVVLLDDNCDGELFRQAHRSLKGSVLRSEVYAIDVNLPNAGQPRVVQEQNYTVNLIQPLGASPYGIFLTYARESMSYECDQTLDDGRLHHTMILQTDSYGNVLKNLAISYGRKAGKSTLTNPEDVEMQTMDHLVYGDISVTQTIDEDNDYRLPAMCETRSWEITGLSPDPKTLKYSISSFTQNNFALLEKMAQIPFEKTFNPQLHQKRLFQRSRSLFRSDDLSKFLPLGQCGALGLFGEGYTLAFSQEYLTSLLQRTNVGTAVETLLSDPAATLGSPTQGAYVDLEGNSQWWVPSGRQYFARDATSTAAQELSEARKHFFVPRRHVDQFGDASMVDYDAHDLLPSAAEDALGNIVTGEVDYRALHPYLVTDANGNRVQCSYDALGLVSGNAAMGKVSQSLGDNLDGFEADLTQAELDSFFENPKGPIAAALLANATSRIVYDPLRYWNATIAGTSSDLKPAFAATMSRETHFSDSKSGSKLQIDFGYSDGYGHTVQHKRQAEPGPVGNQALVNTRWSADGWTVYNNKGLAVKKFEPFFDTTHEFAPAQTKGVCSIMIYDTQGRNVVSLHPNHTWEKRVFRSWQIVEYDVNDTSGESDARSDPDVGAYFSRLPSSDFLPSWVDARKQGQLGVDERFAATKTLAHINTPCTKHFDSLGRGFLAVTDNGKFGGYETRTLLDIQSNLREIIDSLGRTINKTDYNMLGNVLHQNGMENGERWILNDSAGRAFLSWDSRGHRFRTVYDALGRVAETFVQSASGKEMLVSRNIYGETLSDPTVTNSRGKIYQNYDQAGAVTNNAYDFKGNLVQSSRQLWTIYNTTIDVADPPPFESETYGSYFTYDALNRIVRSTTPEGSVIEHTYNEAGLLDTVAAQLINSSGDVQAASTSFVHSIQYNARGQRTSVQYGNGTICRYTYDDLTYRLMRQQLQKGKTSYQDLAYVYDPVGNVTAVHDAAQQTVFFKNAIVEPSTDYTFDPLYRLISSSGREHLGQTNGKPDAPSPPTPNNKFQTRLIAPGDGNAMGKYLETYSYDDVGNLQALHHAGSSPQKPGWTQKYTYSEPSALENGKSSNRLSSTSVGSKNSSYAYDMHGNMTKMPHLSSVQWDYKDQLQATSQQILSTGTPETTYYVYDDSGKRVRKVTERAATAGEQPLRLKQRIYIGALFELYQEFGTPSLAVGNQPLRSLQRNTLHVLDDKEAIALVETRTFGTDPAPDQLTRYSHGNHLGSVALELSGIAEVISYEEYFPYGSTSFQSVRNQTDAPKRYRYTGKERDEESGLYYHGSRYYACWLCRWISCDPSGLSDGPNLYLYSRANPVTLSDPNGCDASDSGGLLEGVKKKAAVYLDHAIEYTKGEGDAALELGEGFALMSIAPSVAGALTVKQMADTYKEYGGGVDGGIMAINVLNPAYHAMVNGYEAYQAYERGDFRELGHHTSLAAVDTLSTGAVAFGGAGLVTGMAEGSGAAISESVGESLASSEGEVLTELGNVAKEALSEPTPVPPPEPPVAPAPEPPAPPAEPATPAEPPAAAPVEDDGLEQPPPGLFPSLQDRLIPPHELINLGDNEEVYGQTGRGTTDGQLAKAQDYSKRHNQQFDRGHPPEKPFALSKPGDKVGRIRLQPAGENRSEGAGLIKRQVQWLRDHPDWAKKHGYSVRPKAPPKKPSTPKPPKAPKPPKTPKGPKGGPKKKK